MPWVSQKQLEDMKRGCHYFDCYKCKHTKIGDKADVCNEDLDCDDCKRDCPCKTCIDGSNWEWEALK